MSYPSSISSYVAKGAFAVTPGTAVISARGLWVGGAGNVTVITSKGETVTFAGVSAGQVIPIAVTGVTGATTATLILGLTN